MENSFGLNIPPVKLENQLEFSSLFTAFRLLILKLFSNEYRYT